MWVLRVVWAVLPVVAGPVFAEALDGASRPVQVVASLGLWAGWLLGMVASLVRLPVALTAMRLLTPAAPVAVLAAAPAGGDAGGAWVAAAAATAMVAAVVSMLAEVGEAFVQGAAYGDERRFPLRPPGPLLAGPLPVAWALLALTVAGGPLLLAARQWVAGALVTAAGVALAALLTPRFHRLSRRWLVLVPAGLVLHDHVVLADTAMFRWGDVAGVGLAEADTEAFDLTGRALGNALDVRLATTGTVVVAGTLEHRQGRSIHLRSFLCSPSRPGRVVTAVADRRARRAARPAP